MDDYYDLSGVEPDAPVADIRAAYRDRKAAVVGARATTTPRPTPPRSTRRGTSCRIRTSGAATTSSSPTPTGRNTTSDEDDDDVVDVPATRTRTTAHEPIDARRRAPRPAAGRRRSSCRAGVTFPPTRARIVAMVIDLVVLDRCSSPSSAYVTDALEKSQQPHAHHMVMTVLPDQIKAAHDATSAAKKKASDERQLRQADQRATTRRTATAKDARRTTLNKEFTEQTKKLTPIRTLVSGIFFLVALLVLLSRACSAARPSGSGCRRSGSSGSTARPRASCELFRRYGLMALAAFVFSLLLQGPIGALVVVFVATMWTRNPNQQGLQDRFAKTLVVTGQRE